MSDAGFILNRTTLYRWRQLPQFIEVVHLQQKWIYECLGISKESVLLDAEKVKQIALNPQPILHQGKDTGFKEVQLGPALRAIEMQGKGVGITDGADRRVQVNIDIDFSGRVDGADRVDDAIEVEYEHVD